VSRYNKVERIGALVLSRFPLLKSFIKKNYQRLNLLLNNKNYKSKSDFDLVKLSVDGRESFFGYYDKSPINKTNEYIIFQSSPVDTQTSPDSNSPVDLIIFDIKEKTYKTVDKLYAYNWQQGSKLMWLDDYKFIYNNFCHNSNTYVSKIYNIQTGELKTINHPIYDCYIDEFAISLNFERLNIGRADYSYSNKCDQIDWSDNEFDGLFYIDLDENTSRLIVTLGDIIKLNYKESMDGAKHKFNHIMISPDGKKLMFMHRWFTSDNRRYDTLWSCDINGELLSIVSDDDMVSHCYWYDNDNIFAYLRDHRLGDKYYLINTKSKNKKIVGKGIIDSFGDGHPSIYNDRVLFDTYPDKSRMKHMYIFDLKKNKLIELGEFYESFYYYDETRCDLHPRFNYDGTKVFFDSVHEGQRHLYMLELQDQ